MSDRTTQVLYWVVLATLLSALCLGISRGGPA